MSDSLRPHELRHTRLPCPLVSPGVAQTHVHEAVMPSNHLILAIMKKYECLIMSYEYNCNVEIEPVLSNWR